MRHPGEFTNRPRLGKLRGYRREPREKSSPCGLAFRQFQLFRQPFRDGNPGTDHAVVETQDPHPSALKDVMHGGIVHRVRRISPDLVIGHPVTAMDAYEVRIERLRRRKIIKSLFAESERPAQEPARAAGIRDQSRSDFDGLSTPFTPKRRPAVRQFDRMQLRLIEIFRAGRDGFLQQEIVNVRAQPMPVGGLIIRDRRRRVTDSNDPPPLDTGCRIRV